MDAINPNAIPHALTSRAQWVVWRYEARESDSKPTKVPYQALRPQRKASSKAPHTWASFQQALTTAQKHDFNGIGYVFSPDDPFVGFDLDGILDDAGHVADWAQPWLKELATYVEISPSGHGIKGVAIGKLPGAGINAQIVEMYDQGRYFAITGQRFDDCPKEPHELNGTIDRLYAFAQQHKAKLDAEREQRRQQAYAQAALNDEADKVRNTPEGMRNDALNVAAFALAGFIPKGLLTEDAIVSALTSSAGTAGLGAAEIRSTLRSGMRAGEREARDVPPPADKQAGMPVQHTILPSAEHTESAIILERLHILGYSFRLNLCTDTVEVNGRPLSDITAAKIRMDLRDIGLHKKIKAAEDAYIAEAEKNAYHPVKDYLNGLKWDGRDHIGTLTSFLHSSDPPVEYADGSTCPLHVVYIYRWLIGAVAKALDARQNPMLVLDSIQGLGKSFLVKWLCSSLPAYFIEGPINVTDKDSDVRLMGRWLWEVSELDATTRKADQSALKAFITKEIVSVRKAYGRYDIIKPALASLVGTVNNTSGFLADESGSRRFMITRLEYIDRRYTEIDIDQLWAQAVHLYRSGEQWALTSEEAQAQQATNERYEVETTLDDWIERYYVFDPSYTTPVSLADVLVELARADIRLSGSERMQAAELARSLSRHGAKRVHTRQGKRWIGLLSL